MGEQGTPRIRTVEVEDPKYVIDRNHEVWKIVRDGGMATKADYVGVTSIGIEMLRRTRGPLLPFDPKHYVAWITGEDWKGEVSSREAIRSELIRQHMAGECGGSVVS